MADRIVRSGTQLGLLGDWRSSGAWNCQGDSKYSKLYSDSIVALDADTGKLRWYYQEIPHDIWDQDASWELLLMDRPVNGKMRKLVVQFSKAGYTFVLDRETGELLNVYPYAESNNWVKGISPKGELIGRNDPVPGKTTKICPTVGGVKNWNQVAYSPRTELVYVPAVEMCNDLTLAPASVNGQTGSYTWVFTAPPGHATAYSHLDAIEPITGKKQWTYPYKFQIFASILTTAGDLMFTGDPEGHFFALGCAQRRRSCGAFKLAPAIADHRSHTWWAGGNTSPLPRGWGTSASTTVEFGRR